MGFFESNYIVEFEYSPGFFSSTKKGTMVVKATGEPSAKKIAKQILEQQFKFIKILGAHKSSGKKEEKEVSYVPPVHIEEVKEPQIAGDFSCKTSITTRTASCESEAEKAARQAKIKQIMYTYEQALQTPKMRKAKRAPWVALIISSISTIIVFVLGFIPTWIIDYNLDYYHQQYDEARASGYKIDSPEIRQIVDNLDYWKVPKNDLLIEFLPYILLLIGIIVTTLLTVLLYYRYQRKKQQLLDVLRY